MKGFLIAGTASGVGKTTVTLALLAAMRRRGMVPQAFKGGPDFLDTGHLTRISGRIARNLDTWLLDLEANHAAFRQAAVGADAVVVEGMMGLFDGKGGITESGSAAELAKWMKLPVVLVLDAAKSARSVAAVVLGFERFDPELPLAGVILNRVAGERHFQMLETAISAACKTPIVGWLPREPTIGISERHLGLHTVEESEPDNGQSQIDALGELAERHIDLERVFALECGLDIDGQAKPHSNEASGVRIGVARDRAFSFYYEDNLDLLRQAGAALVPFSPLEDPGIPKNVDAIYFGGGYPELYAAKLSANQAMLASIRAFAASGRPVYAECGGMIYLSRQLTTIDGTAHPMAEVFPFAIEMTGKLVKFGYVTVEVTNDCLLGASGTMLRGHSFHYSRLVQASDTATSYQVEYSLSGKKESEGYSVGNVLGSYIHLHFRAAPEVARHFVDTARRMQSAEAVPA